MTLKSNKQLDTELDDRWRNKGHIHNDSQWKHRRICKACKGYGQNIKDETCQVCGGLGEIL